MVAGLWKVADTVFDQSRTVRICADAIWADSGDEGRAHKAT